MVYIWVIVFIPLLLVAYVRFAPSDPARWHVVPSVVSNGRHKCGVKRRLTVDERSLNRFDTIAVSEPRTERLAGSVQEGMVTYVSRSRLIGFPDYTTAHQDGDDLVICARQRFGRSDFGVNAERVDRWLAALTGT